MGINIVKYYGSVIVDMTDATVTPETLAEGVKAYDAKGNLITGTAKITPAGPSYKNLFSTSDPNYSIGRLNSSGAVNTSYTNGFVSGFIEAKFGDIVRAKSANTAFANNYGIIAFYKSDKTYINQIYANDSAGRVVLSSDGKEFTCDTSKLASSFQSTGFVRIMGYGSPDGFIITKNEEITE